VIYKEFSVFILSLLFFTGCQQKPTIGVTDSGVLVQNKDYRKLVQHDSVVFDTRSPFEFNTSKIPGSVNLPAGDFEASKDPLDSARRLSLYGIELATPVVIVGDGHGDEQKLAWEFAKLGVTNIETLRTNVFRMLNIQPEPPKKNVTLWKPLVNYGELSQVQFENKIETFKPKMGSKARSAVYQGVPVGMALRKRTLVFTTDNDWKGANKYLFADHIQLKPGNYFDENGLFDAAEFKRANDVNIRNYDIVFLFDSTEEKATHAYSVLKAGAKSLYLVR